MRKGSLRELLAKLKHDPRENEADYLIVIAHRGGENDQKVIPVELIELGNGYFFVGETQIPYHQILRVVRRDGTVIWEKRKR